MKVESESGQQVSVTFAVVEKLDIPSMGLFGLYAIFAWRNITRRFLRCTPKIWRRKNDSRFGRFIESD